MKTHVHPEYQPLTVTCRCGNCFETRSSHGKSEVHVEVCSNCHPLYTGKTATKIASGALDKFLERYSNYRQS